MKTRISWFVEELKRRKVPGTALTYLFVGWLLIESSSVMMPELSFPSWAPRMVMYIVITGFPVILVLSWFFDITLGDDRTLKVVPAPSVDTALASMVILPFDCVSDKNEHQGMAKALALDTATKLSRYPRLRIVSGLAFATREQTLSLEQLRTEFGVRFVLSGTLFSSADKMRINVVLDDALHKEQIWGETFTFAPEEVVGVLDELSDAIAVAFGVARMNTEFNHVLPEPSSWSRLQRARGLLLEDAVDEAAQLTQSLLAEQPDYADALAVAALVNAEQLLRASNDQQRQQYAEQALLHAKSAVQKAAHDPFVLKLAGTALSLGGERDTGLEYLLRAIQLAPLDAGARGYLGWALTSRGQPGDLETLLEHLDVLAATTRGHPGRGMCDYHRSVLLTCQSKREAAREYAMQAVQLHPQNPLLRFNLANLLADQDPELCRQHVQTAAAGPWPMQPAVYVELLRFMVVDKTFVAARLQGLISAQVVPAAHEFSR